MNLLLFDEIRAGQKLPDFGGEFARHMEEKRNPDVRTASLSAWNLLAEGLRSLGMETLPEVAFPEGGKPVFKESPLHFSLSHSGGMCAALISGAPCGVDIEMLRPEFARRLRNRVLSPGEQAQNCDFFEIWTEKEAAGKLGGAGIPAKPCTMDLSEYKNLNRLRRRVFDSAGREYALCALCQSPEPIKIPDSR